MTVNHLDLLDLDSDSNSIVEGLFLTPFQQKLLKKNLQEDLRQEYQHRIQIMLMADRGHSQAEIRKTLRCSQDTIRYWIAIARSGQAHLWKQFAVGRPKSVNEEYCQRLKELVCGSPRDYGYAFQRWTACWLSKHLAKELGITVSDRHINRLLKSMGLSTRMQLDTTSPKVDASNSSDCHVAIRDLPNSPSTQGTGRNLSNFCLNTPDPKWKDPKMEKSASFQVFGMSWTQSAAMEWKSFNPNNTAMEWKSFNPNNTVAMFLVH